MTRKISVKYRTTMRRMVRRIMRKRILLVVVVVLLLLLLLICQSERGMVHGSIDVNLSELEYLASHLEPQQECRRLVAALHYDSFELPAEKKLIEAERKLEYRESSCLRLLLHWNSSPNEGQGETHEQLGRRLRQLGRAELADWLGKTVFRELGKDLLRSADADAAPLLTVNTIITNPISTIIIRDNDYDEQQQQQQQQQLITTMSLFVATTRMTTTMKNTTTITTTCRSGGKNTRKLENLWLIIIDAIVVLMLAALIFTLITLCGLLIIDKQASCEYLLPDA